MYLPGRYLFIVAKNGRLYVAGWPIVYVGRPCMKLYFEIVPKMERPPPGWEENHKCKFVRRLKELVGSLSPICRKCPNLEVSIFINNAYLYCVARNTWDKQIVADYFCKKYGLWERKVSATCALCKFFLSCLERGKGDKACKRYRPRRWW